MANQDELKKEPALDDITQDDLEWLYDHVENNEVITDLLKDVITE